MKKPKICGPGCRCPKCRPVIEIVKYGDGCDCTQCVPQGFGNNEQQTKGKGPVVDLTRAHSSDEKKILCGPGCRCPKCRPATQKLKNGDGCDCRECSPHGPGCRCPECRSAPKAKASDASNLLEGPLFAHTASSDAQKKCGWGCQCPNCRPATQKHGSGCNCRECNPRAEAHGPGCRCLECRSAAEERSYASNSR